MTNDNKLETSEAISFLEKETVTLQKSTKTTLIAGSLIVVLLAAYMSWLTGIVKNDFLNPQSLSQATVGMLEESLPGYFIELEKGLISAAPDSANELVKRINSIFPSFRLMLQNEFDESMKLLPTLDREIQSGVASYLKTHQDEIKSLYKAHDDRDFAKNAVDGVFDSLKTELLFHGHNVDTIRSQSITLLQNLLDDLEVMSKKTPGQLTSLEKKKIKLIATLFANLPK